MALDDEVLIDRDVRAALDGRLLAKRGVSSSSSMHDRMVCMHFTVLSKSSHVDNLAPHWLGRIRLPRFSALRPALALALLQ